VLDDCVHKAHSPGQVGATRVSIDRLSLSRDGGTAAATPPLPSWRRAPITQDMSRPQPGPPGRGGCPAEVRGSGLRIVPPLSRRDLPLLPQRPGVMTPCN
jgi:hypothetical protein